MKQRNTSSTSRTALLVFARGAFILLLSGFLGASLVRLAPGFAIDDRALDERFSAASRESLRRESDQKRAGRVAAFYYSFITGLARGDAGQSTLFDRPVTSLIAARVGVTTRAVTTGLAIGWLAGLTLATVAALSKRAAFEIAATLMSSSLVSVPSAVLAIVCLLLDFPPGVAIGAVVLPQVFSHATEQLRTALEMPHVIMARARGLGRARVFLWHVAPATFAPMLALFGLSVTLAFGAAIPVEALADSPGLGQLAWQAALGRDLPLLVAITLLITAVTVTANSFSEIVVSRARWSV